MSTSLPTKRVVIIGAGFSGSLTAINLARLKGDLPLEIYLVERRESFGPGLAYSPPSDRFKLNVKAKAMGAFPEDPEGFLRWAKERGHVFSPDAYVSRGLYGEYLRELLHETTALESKSSLHLVRDEATNVSYDESSHSFSITLRGGNEISADACVVAVGNLTKRSLDDSQDPTIFREPYDPASYRDVAKLSSLVIIGSSLTAVDVIVETHHLGFRGHYTVVSRHGYLPLPHETAATTAPTLPEGWVRYGSARKLLSMVREISRQRGSSQPVIDAMRPQLQAMWLNLPLAERQRFLRHIKPVWEIHRHRIPEEHALLLNKLQSEARLDLVAGRVTSLRREGSSGVVRLSPKGRKAAARTLTCDAVFMCAGIEGDLSRVSDPLIANLVRKRLLETGPLKIGASQASKLLKAPNFWLIGTLQREARWEITAVRELREEALTIARDVIAIVSQPSV